MRMLCLAKYPRGGPSSRYRLYQFVPFLEADGIAVDVHSLHDEHYLSRRFAASAPATSPAYLARRVVSRLARVATARRHDVVFIQKEIFPHAPGVVEALLDRFGLPLVLDIDDAIHLPYRGTRLDGKIERVIARSRLVLAGNRWLADYARRFNERVELFPTVVDTARFTPGTSTRDVPVVGWMGSPATSSYLQERAEVFAAVAREAAFDMLVVGAALEPSGAVPRVESRPWSLASEADDLRAMDIGVMPLPPGEWSEGKCALKLLQYMSAGLATVSSPTGAVRDIIDHGVNGLIADGEDEWRRCLLQLVTDTGARRRMGERARAWVDANYSLARFGPRLPRLVREAARAKGRHD